VKGIGFLGYVGLYCIIKIGMSRGGNFIDRLLSSGISFRLPHVSAGGIINGASKNNTEFRPVRSF